MLSVVCSGDPELMGFLEWWEDLYGPEFLDEHPGEGKNGHDPVTEQILEKAKLEFKTGVVRHTWEMKRAANMTEWRRCVRDNEDVGKCQSEEDHLVFEIRQAKMYERLARKERNLIGQNVFWLRNASCVPDNTSLWQAASKIRADPGYQWFGLIVNLINVFGLMSEDTACEPPDCTNSYQNDILPILDWFAQIFFTFDMINSMIVLGFASYFDNSFLQLDFLVVLTGWMQVAQIGMDVSALRALRVLRPMCLVKYFKGPSLHCAFLCFPVLYCAFLCFAVFRCVSLFFTAFCCALLCFTVSYCVSLCLTVLHCVSLCFTVFHCALLCFTMRCCVSLCVASKGFKQLLVQLSTILNLFGM